MKSPGRLSVFAGAGDLVPHIVDAALAAGYKVQVLALVPRPDICSAKVVEARLDNPLGIIWSLKIFRTTHIVMAGGIDLPDSARQGLIRFANGNVDGPSDASDAPVGDAALSALATVLKKMTGADLIGAHEVSPDLLATPGLIAGPEASSSSVVFALQTARAIGALDIGQAAVVSGRRVIAVEDIGGTDALIARAGVLRDAGLAGDGVFPLILAKAMKPQQPGFVDLPAIGPTTISNCARAGISIVAIEAGRSLVLQRADLAQLAADLAVTVIALEFSDV